VKCFGNLAITSEGKCAVIVFEELFFDIEVDPCREFCYLHGFVERQNGNNETERFVSFFADAMTPEAEKQAFAEASMPERSDCHGSGMDLEGMAQMFR
jgi:hypothetical protein